MNTEQRLFSGVYPTGIYYADRKKQKNGDYMKIGFLSFATLELKVYNNPDKELKDLMFTDAAAIQARRGEKFQKTTSGQFVILGFDLPDVDEAKAEAAL